MDTLFHYTNIESLALILKNKTIRFNSLDNMDDLQENITKDVQNAGQFTYVSCWTDKIKENIALWKQYTDHDSGVRIELPKHPFKKYDSTKYIEIIRQNTNLNVISNEQLITMINFDDMMIKDYSTFTIGQIQLIPIEYTENEDDLVPRIVYNSKDNIEIFMDRIGRYKDEAWRYQYEWRYKIQFVPVNFLEGIRNNQEKFVEVYNKIINGTAVQPFKYYDFVIADNAFDQMKITLSPTITAGNEELIRCFAERYNPKAEIFESKFKGLIR